MRIYKIKQTCIACPAQWEGQFADGRPFYVRYRWGYLSIRAGKKGKDVFTAVSGREIYGEQLDKEGWDGVISEGKVRKIIYKIPEENKIKIIYKDVFYRISCIKFIRLFWYHCLGGKKIISQQIKNTEEQLAKVRKELHLKK